MISKLNLLKDIDKTQSSDKIEYFQPVKNTFRGENSRLTEMDKQFLRNILQDTQAQSKSSQNITTTTQNELSVSLAPKQSQPSEPSQESKPSKGFNFGKLEDMGDMMDDDLDDSDWGSSQKSDEEEIIMSKNSI